MPAKKKPSRKAARVRACKPGRFSRHEGAKLLNLWFAGASMANVCFNLKQDVALPGGRRATLRMCQEDWDRRSKEAMRLLREARRALGIPAAGKHNPRRSK